MNLYIGVIGIIVIIFLVYVFSLVNNRFRASVQIIEVSEYFLDEVKIIKSYTDQRIGTKKSNNIDMLKGLDYESILEIRQSLMGKSIKQKYINLYLDLTKISNYCRKKYREKSNKCEVTFSEQEMLELVNKIEEFEESFNTIKKSANCFQKFSILSTLIFFIIVAYILEFTFKIDDNYYKDLALLNATFSIGVGTLLISINGLIEKKNEVKKKQIIKFISFEFPMFFLVNIVLLIIPFLKIPDFVQLNTVSNLIFIKFFKAVPIALGLTATVYIVFKIKKLFENLIK